MRSLGFAFGMTGLWNSFGNVPVLPFGPNTLDAEEHRGTSRDAPGLV
jgi:hypothetical protein